jgi:uncharacterized protein GlcG (DUF336 family)
MITLSDARCIVAGAEEKAREMGQPMNIAVVDAGGNLVSHARMDSASVGCIDLSINKAACSFDIPTAELAEKSQPGQPVLVTYGSSNGRVRIFAGGAPLWRGGSIIGAIGVSGGSTSQDAAIAAAAIAALGNSGTAGRPLADKTKPEKDRPEANWPARSVEGADANRGRF